jgi:phosphoribosylanthranilate isomerase
MTANRRLLVKVCGITRREDGLAAIAAGVDALGFVLWPGSRRAVTAERTRELTADIPVVLKVGVFVDATRDEIFSAVEMAGLDIVQLHGAGETSLPDGLPVAAWKAMRVGPAFDPEAAVAFAARSAGLLLDSMSDRGAGGTGESFDWSVAEALRPRVNYLILAGGLDPENVYEAILKVRPDVVDVSSGVETSPGVKDSGRIGAFVRRAREAERGLWGPLV